MTLVKLLRAVFWTCLILGVKSQAASNGQSAAPAHLKPLVLGFTTSISSSTSSSVPASKPSSAVQHFEKLAVQGSSSATATSVRASPASSQRAAAASSSASSGTASSSASPSAASNSVDPKTASRGPSFAIQGVSGGVNSATGQRPFRLEFSKLASSGPAFDLYILALQQFHSQDQGQQLSYFKVAGIHGLPYEPWDGVQGRGQGGYCTHGSILFPAWHRPYLALFEQLIWQNAQTIAATYTGSQLSTYQQAAVTLRIPYWDWASNATMPDLTNAAQITINGPRGQQTISNPLNTYAFHPKPPPSEFPASDKLSSFANTVRYPDANGNSQPQLVNKQLQANGQSLHDLTYQLIVDQANYGPFSNTGYNDARGGHYNSIENMHNSIHSLVGNGGHMAVIPYSAFDPIFWLHHTNVDRLFDIWQAIHPDSYTVPEVNAEGTFTDAPGSTENIDTPLTPFHSNSAGTLYTSQTARSTKTFGYSYPEVVDWGVSATQLSTNVRANLNKLYNPSGSLSGRSLAARDSGLSNSTNCQFFINIRVDKSALCQAFFIHFFLGDVPLSPKQWSFAPSLIGTYSVLYYESPIATNTTVYGQIPLNHAILDTDLNSLDSSVVIPYLSKHLSWQVQLYNDQAIATNDPRLESLKIFVVGREVVNEGGGSAFPEYGPLEIFVDATDGKPGALGNHGGM